MGRLRERVLDLQRHFGQANQDIEKILTSSERIASRGNKIEALDFEGEAASAIKSNGVTPLAANSQGPARAAEPAEPRRARIMRQPDLLPGE
jgi:DNA recombination protein RmuC